MVKISNCVFFGIKIVTAISKKYRFAVLVCRAVQFGPNFAIINQHIKKNYYYYKVSVNAQIKLFSSSAV